MFACTLAFAEPALTLGVAVTVVFALPVLFELSAVLQAAQKAAMLSKPSKPTIRRIEVPPMVYQEISAVRFGAGMSFYRRLIEISVTFSNLLNLLAFQALDAARTRTRLAQESYTFHPPNRVH